VGVPAINQKHIELQLRHLHCVKGIHVAVSVALRRDIKRLSSRNTGKKRTDEQCPTE
jgi:hypothetical protein